MSVNWFYVEGKEKVGPISLEELKELVINQTLSEQDYVWRKGFDNWKKVHEVDELQSKEANNSSSRTHSTNVDILPWDSINPHDKRFFVLIGQDRGQDKSAQYGPFTLTTLKKIYEEKRINSKTYIWTIGMPEWQILADLPLYHKHFSTEKVEIKPDERRTQTRVPFVARVYFHNNQELFEGVCRDISVGGMQVLVANFLGDVGETISLNVHPSEEKYHFVASGEIVRILDNNEGFSFRFTNLNDKVKSIINSYIQSVE